MAKKQEGKYLEDTLDKKAITFPYHRLLSDNAPQAFLDYYDDADILDAQIAKPSVFNVAVVAKYGAGKSSVINTYLSRHCNKKTWREKLRIKETQLRKLEKNRYTRVSLATFIGTKYDETAVERSILQQLLYSRKKRELPHSKIERTNRTSPWRAFFFALIATLFVAATSLFGIEIGGTNIFGADWTKYLYMGVSGTTLILILAGLLHYQKLERIKYKDLEADLQQILKFLLLLQLIKTIKKFILI